MDRVKALVCALACALVASFALAASAQDDYDAVDDTDTPYIDAEGNIDYEMAKDYAVVVGGWVEDGIEWDLWLDDLGGMMWAEPKGGAFTLTSVRQVLYPDTVTVLTGGDSCYFKRTDWTDGYLIFDSEISCSGYDHCFRWWAWAMNDDPTDATGITGYATSYSNYCDDDYVGWYAPPGGGWVEDVDPMCYQNGSNYVYWLGGNGGFNGTSDYGIGDKMVQ